MSQLLTGRQRQVLELLAQGLTAKEVASTLGISEQTVKNHSIDIHRKYEVGNTVAAVALAITRGDIFLDKGVTTA